MSEALLTSEDEQPDGDNDAPDAAASPDDLRSAEDWARDYLLSTRLADKTNPGPFPRRFRGDAESLDLRPGRPVELVVTEAKPKSVKLGALQHPRARAELIHKFWHHELQAAELMCWAVLKFPETPVEFREGLLRICRDEIRHMGLYEEHMRTLGHALGDFPVRDWFWERVATCTTPLQFVAFIGMGLEGANLEHTERFATWFRTLGDVRGADIQDQVGREEVAHVRFATRWFRAWTGDVDFATWCSHLPPPITPLLLKGKTLGRERRRKAEMPEPFLDELDAWTPDNHVERREP